MQARGRDKEEEEEGQSDQSVEEGLRRESPTGHTQSLFTVLGDIYGTTAVVILF